ncbi:MAG: hypothetical protein NC338_06365 [Firmicutes bacterium]|nr:hypothetical protein [Bacillota bacterium]MCM1401558.1 hypothetical protein [Bacteroides sp.]MCM1477252.1 hypothetical protein [Bacteroides sp.]
MKFSHFMLATLLAFCSSGNLIAQPAESLADQLHDSIVASQKVVVIGGKSDISTSQSHSDSVRYIIEQFYVDQFRHFQDPESPYFLFLSRDASLAMGIGGAVRMRGYFDWGGAIPASGFAPYLIPMNPDPAKMRKFGTTPAGTCLFFRVIGRNKKLGNYSLYIEANFNGYSSRDFHLKKAYATINDFTIGYASSTFSDPAAVPATVDAQGPNNKLANTSVLVRWMPRVKERWVFAISAETPSTSVSVDNVDTEKVDEWCPDGAAFVQYEWGRTSHIRLSGILRSLSYRNMLQAKNHYLAGWGVQLSGVGHPISPVTVYGTLNYGKGYAGLGGDLLIGAYDLIGNPDAPGVLYAPKSYGWNIGLQYNFTPTLFTSASFSQTRFLPSRKVAPEEYRYGLFGNINVFWNLTPRIQVAAEFDIGKRKNFSGDSRWAKRVGAMCQFSF